MTNERFVGPDTNAPPLPGPRNGIVRAVYPTGMLDLNGVAISGKAIARVPGHPRLEAEVHFVEHKGNRVFTWVWIRHPDETRMPPDGITWKALRALSLPRIQREIDSTFRQWTDSPRVADLAKRFGERPGRRGRGDYDYAIVAATYVNNLANKAPVKKTAEKLHMSPGSVRDQLHIARRRGLLTAARQGVPGGALTEKGIAVLAEKPKGRKATTTEQTPAPRTLGRH